MMNFEIEQDYFESPNCPQIVLTVPELLAEFQGSFEDCPVDSIENYLASTQGEKEMVFCLAILPVEFFQNNQKLLTDWVREHPLREVRILLLSKHSVKRHAFGPLFEKFIFLILPEAVDREVIVECASNALYSMRIRFEKIRLQSRLATSSLDIQRLTRVGQSMATERDFDVLISMVLDYAREMATADAGSIYVVERKASGDPATHLRFKKSAMDIDADEFLLPIDKNSIAGYVALTGRPLLIDDVYALEGTDYHFNFAFDQSQNYHSKSMLVIPMKNHRNDVIGVIQLINKKENFNQKLSPEEMKGEAVLPFTVKCLELVSALAGQAAVAIQNNMLLNDIHNLFEGFVKASVTAIEQRDPTTSGHSFRVAELTTGLAVAVDRLSQGRFGLLNFTGEQLRELRYASLLHDFGKVGVREEVLVKAKKLYEPQMENIGWRFRYMRMLLQKRFAEKKIQILKEKGAAAFAEYEGIIDYELALKLKELDDIFATIEDANEPSVMETGEIRKLEEIALRSVSDDDGTKIPFLRDNELVSLQVRRGNLDARERLEIESHVSHTYRFLIQIPWTTDLRNIPDIAHGHHEKIDGSGYPLGLRQSEISPQARMMTISDIYDALTAPDRPYKKSVTAERALDILHLEARENHVDPDLLKVFVEAEVYKNVSPDDGKV